MHGFVHERDRFFGGLTISYRTGDGSSVRIAVILSAPSDVLAIYLPNAEVTVCARNFRMTGNIGGKLSLECTETELIDSAVCLTVTGAFSSILNGGRIFKLLKSLSCTGNDPTVLFDFAEWLATVCDSETLCEVLSESRRSLLRSRFPSISAGTLRFPFRSVCLYWNGMSRSH